MVTGLNLGPLHRTRIGRHLEVLLTSAGVKNASIHNAVVDLLGKPIAESSALCIATAHYGHPMVGPGTRAWRFISGTSDNSMVELGWRSVGVLELTAQRSLDEERWVPMVRDTDVLLPACRVRRTRWTTKRPSG